MQGWALSDLRKISFRYKPYSTRKVRHALLKRAICTIILAIVHIACFISANYGFLHYLFSATMGVFQNSACWHIDGTIGKTSDRTRNTSVCVHADSTGRPFKVNATYSVARECVTVVVTEDEHNCTGVRPVERSFNSRQDWLQRVLPTTITISKATTPATIQDAVAHEHGVQIEYQDSGAILNPVYGTFTCSTCSLRRCRPCIGAYIL